MKKLCLNSIKPNVFADHECFYHRTSLIWNRKNPEDAVLTLLTF